MGIKVSAFLYEIPFSVCFPVFRHLKRRMVTNSKDEYLPECLTSFITSLTNYSLSILRIDLIRRIIFASEVNY